MSITVIENQLHHAKDDAERAVESGLLKVERLAYLLAIRSVAAEIGKIRALPEHKAIGLAACEAVLMRLVPPPEMP